MKTSFNDLANHQQTHHQVRDHAFSVERRAANGNYIAYACGTLKRPRYINEKIEQELVEFKIEIEERFAASKVNKVFRFPRLTNDEVQQIIKLPFPSKKLQFKDCRFVS